MPIYAYMCACALDHCHRTRVSPSIVTNANKLDEQVLCLQLSTRKCRALDSSTVTVSLITLQDVALSALQAVQEQMYPFGTVPFVVATV